jgi:hypothetical protein
MLGTAWQYQNACAVPRFEKHVRLRQLRQIVEFEMGIGMVLP